MIGGLVLHYRILERLGGGGMGVVYKAKDTRLRRLVALKFLPEALSRDPQARERFVREAQAASALNHPHICTIFDIDAQEGQRFIAMELLEGQTLQQRLRGRRLDVDETVRVAREVAEGLDAAHAKGIIHRDIKPGNLFITAAGPVKILDFGLAKLVAADRDRATALETETGEALVTASGTLFGTVAYMSPEQALGKDLDARTDLFSLGVVLYEMATGTLPFRGDTSAAVIDSLLHRSPPSASRLNPDLPEALERIIAKGLEKDREVRYQSARDVRCDLTRLGRERESPPVPAAAVRATRGPSLAVLPFANMSPDRENEYFCDGLSEELINALTHVRELQVAARMSAFAFKGRDIDIREVGRALNVGAVLEGSVRKSGQRLRITAQLINVEDGYHLWSRQFDREMKDVFDIQEEISLTIVEHLRLRLPGGEKEQILHRATADHEAYECFLMGRTLWYRRHEGGIHKALSYFQKAVEKDPDYALPYVGIADALGTLGMLAFLPPREAFPRAKVAATRAMELHPDLAEAHTSLGMIAMCHDWDWAAAEDHFLQAARLKSDYAPTHHWYGNFLACMGRFDESIREMRRACRLEPLEPVFATHLGLALAVAGRHDESIKVLRAIIESDPEFWIPYWYLSINLLVRREWGEAIAALTRLVELTRGAPLALSVLGHAQGMAGMTGEARAVLGRLDELAKERYVGHFHKAWVWLALGDRVRALAGLEAAYEARGPFMAWLRVYGPLNPLRDEPRLVDLLRRLKLQ